MLGELSQPEIDSFLREHCYARLGCHADDETYVVPVSFAFDGNRLIGQTKAGRKIEMMRKNPKVCVEVDHIESIADWTSVVVWATYEELHGPAAAEAMRILIDRLGPHIEELGSSRSPRDVTPGRLDGQPQVDIVYALHIERATGRFEKP